MQYLNNINIVKSVYVFLIITKSEINQFNS